MYIKGQKGHLFLPPRAASLTEMMDYTQPDSKYLSAGRDA